MSAQECVDLLKEKNIRVCVFDMDLTAVAAHSRGRLQRAKLNDYLNQATPDFLALVPLLCQQHEIGVAIATHSDEAEYSATVTPETHILGKDLAQALVRHHFTPQIADQFLIVAYNPRARKVTDEKDLIKRYHMRQIQQQYKVPPEQIIFFDDLSKTVKDCNEYCKVRAIQVDEKVGFQFSDLLENL